MITNVEMNNDNYLPRNDRELPVDIENGWGKIDSQPINAHLRMKYDKTELVVGGTMPNIIRQLML